MTQDWALNLTESQNHLERQLFWVKQRHSQLRLVRLLLSASDFVGRGYTAPFTSLRVGFVKLAAAGHPLLCYRLFHVIQHMPLILTSDPGLRSRNPIFDANCLVFLAIVSIAIQSSSLSLIVTVGSRVVAKLSILTVCGRPTCKRVALWFATVPIRRGNPMSMSPGYWSNHTKQ